MIHISFIVRRKTRQPFMADPITYHHYAVPAPTADAALRKAHSWGLSGELQVTGRSINQGA